MIVLKCTVDFDFLLELGCFLLSHRFKGGSRHKALAGSVVLLQLYHLKISSVRTMNTIVCSGHCFAAGLGSIKPILKVRVIRVWSLVVIDPTNLSSGYHKAQVDDLSTTN